MKVCASLRSRYVVAISYPPDVHALGVQGIRVLPDGHHVSRTSDFIIYAVEDEFIERVVAQYWPCESRPYPDCGCSLTFMFISCGHPRKSEP